MTGPHMKLLLSGGTVVDPSQDIHDRRDILIVDGRIARLGMGLRESLAGAGDLRVLEMGGMTVVPGLIDMHTHLREPGFEYKETIASGSRAAAAGGFTAVACMPNTQPVNDERSVTEFILQQAAACGLARIYPVAAITKRSEGKGLAEFWDLKDAGAVAFSDDGKPVSDSALMRRALEYAFSLNMPVISHCEDTFLSRAGVMNEGLVSTELGLEGIPTIAEDIVVAREIMLAEYTRTAVHIAHVSTAGAVALIRQAKQRGVQVTAETAPHYFTLTDEAVGLFDVNAKVYPPLRTAVDVEAVREGLRDGTIDAIASDHAPHGVTDKEVEFDDAASGMIGLETALGLSLRLVADGVLTLDQLIARMSLGPARILKVPGGTLREGDPADITVIDSARSWTVDSRLFQSKSRNTPFQGWSLTGRAVMTLVGGAITYQA